ncbi:cysteine-rich receptor-like protein kinase [Tanacetum coccineum]
MTMRTKKNIDTLSIDDLYNIGVSLNKHPKGHIFFPGILIMRLLFTSQSSSSKQAKFKGRKQAEAGRGSGFQAARTEGRLMTIDEGYEGRYKVEWGIITPREQEEIDDSLYEYGKHGPQPKTPSPTVSNASSIVFSICPSHDSDGEFGTMFNANSTVYSSCQSNDSDGDQGTISDHTVGVGFYPGEITLPNIPSIEQVTIATQKTQPQVPEPQQTVDPSCAQHVKTPRQPIRTPVSPSPIPSYNRQNWNQRMERELGAGYSFERKPCFVCGSLSHLIKDCDYYEKKMAREAAFKSTRVIHANVRQATPAWTNSNRVNKANQFTPRPVQLNNIRPNFSTASRTIKTGRVNVNTGKQNVSSGSLHVSSGTHIKSGTSSFNTGKQHVNSGSMYVNSGTKNKSGGSRVNTGKQNVNSGRVHVNTARVTRPVLSNQTSQVNFKSPKTCFSKQRSPENRPFTKNTAYKSNNYAVKGKMGTAVKTSAGCVWRKAIPLSNTNSGPTPDSNVNVSRGPQGRPKPVKAWVTRINWRILKNSIGDLLPLELMLLRGINTAGKVQGRYFKWLMLLVQNLRLLVQVTLAQESRKYSSDKAPGPDGFNFKYIKQFWGIIKEDVLKAVSWFSEKAKISKGCNASFVTLVPKAVDPLGLGDFRPISIIGSIYKIIEKILAERVKRVIGNIIGEVQNAFIEGRYILDGVLIANETMEFLKQKKMKGIIFKVDFEKAYDSINWSYLMEIIEWMRFGSRWHKWVMACLRSASISILVSGSPTNKFYIGRGVQQGDPLSPFLFILMAKALNVLLVEAVDKNIFKGTRVGKDKVWDWIRPPRGRAMGDFDNLIELLENVRFSQNKEDKWKWRIDPNEVFSVRYLARWIKEMRVELDKKGIDLDSILCPSCDNVVESVVPCLVLCEKALSVWDRGGVGMEKEARVLWEVVVLVAAYYIWKSRNLRVFKVKNESSSKVFQDIQIKTFGWINRRSKKHKFPWEKLVVRPALCGKHQLMRDVAALN